MRPSIRAGYLDVGSGAAFGQLHLGAGGDSGVAVLMLAPFGWDEVSSYRSRRDWAEALARGGFPTLRVDLPGSGDSTGSPRDPGRLESWSATVAESARWLREATAARRVVAVGLGLGGMLACIAVARDAAIDDLVLWATPARGRRLVRELRAFASLQGADFPELAQGLEPSQAPVGEEPAAQDGSLLVGGFLMTAETISAIERLDLTELSLPAAAGRRVLLLERDGTPVDERLRDHLEAAEAAVEVRPGPGYGRMTAKPHDSQPPLAVFATVTQWLASAPGDGASGETAGAGDRVVARSSSPAGLAGALELAEGDAGVRESLISIDQPGGQLFGVLAEPATGLVEPLCAVLLNAGGIRHTGPNRMWVEAARRWAGSGVVTLRLDLSGLGDAEGDSRSSELDGLYDSGRVPEVRAALDELASRRPESSFVLSGMCSGAYWSLHTALADERVTAALMLNPGAFFWDEPIEKMRELRMGLLDPSLWRKVLRGEIRLGRVTALLRWAPSVPGTAWRRGRARRAGGDQVDETFDRLGDRGQRVLLAFSGREPLYHELAREGRLERLASRSNVVLEALPGETHMLRSLQAQRAAHDLLDRELRAELRRLRG